MNRRNFAKLSLGGLGAVFTLPLMSMTAPPPITWKDFDWTSLPSGLAFRYEDDGAKMLRLTSIPFVVKTTLLTYSSPADVDWAKETMEIPLKVPAVTFMGKKWPDTVPQTVYTNEILLTGAQELGYTHLYAFVSMMYVKDDLTPHRRCYAVRGAKLPDWRTINGKLQTVKV